MRGAEYPRRPVWHEHIVSSFILDGKAGPGVLVVFDPLSWIMLTAIYLRVPLALDVLFVDKIVDLAK